MCLCVCVSACVCVCVCVCARTVNDLVEGAPHQEIRLVEGQALRGPRQRTEEGELLGVGGVPHRGADAKAWGNGAYGLVLGVGGGRKGWGGVVWVGTYVPWARSSFTIQLAI